MPHLKVRLEGEDLELFLPCPEVEELFAGALEREVAETEDLRASLWERILRLFEIDLSPPIFKIFRGEIYMVHPHFLGGSAYSSMPLLLFFEGGSYRVIFRHPIVGVNPYVYYFEGISTRGRKPFLLNSIIHEFAHLAFAVAFLDIEFICKMYRDPRLAMQLPGLGGEFIEKLQENSDELEVVAEVPALWAEEIVASEFGEERGRKVIERRLKLHTARDEALGALLKDLGFSYSEAIMPKRRLELMLEHWGRVRGKKLSEVRDYILDSFERILTPSLLNQYYKCLENCRLEMSSELVEDPLVMGKSLDRLYIWYTFLKRAFNYPPQT